MSDTLRFLSETGDSASDAAQSFLNKKMAENKFSSSPENDPYAWGEGTTPGGPAYDADNPTKGGGGRAGALSSQEIRDKFGLTYNEEHVGGAKDHPNGSNNETGAIYNRETGEYIGTVTNKETAGKDFGNIRQYAKDSGLIQEDIDDYNSLNDVASLASQIHSRGKSGAEKPNSPIKHSPEINQAKQILKDYDIGVRSGAISKGLYGDYTDMEVDESVGKTFEANDGLKGIGTEGGAADTDTADTASQSFLAAKKANVKEQYQFKPAS